VNKTELLFNNHNSCNNVPFLTILFFHLHCQLEDGEVDVRLNSFKGCAGLELRSLQLQAEHARNTQAAVAGVEVEEQVHADELAEDEPADAGSDEDAGNPSIIDSS
jgi:hypothetical protein